VAKDRLLGGLGEENTVRNRDTILRLIGTSQDIYIYTIQREQHPSTTRNSRPKQKQNRKSSEKAPQPNKDHVSQQEEQITEQERRDANENNVQGV
jgi:hypothetical protein